MDKRLNFTENNQVLKKKKSSIRILTNPVSGYKLIQYPDKITQEPETLINDPH